MLRYFSYSLAVGMLLALNSCQPSAPSASRPNAAAESASTIENDAKSGDGDTESGEIGMAGKTKGTQADETIAAPLQTGKIKQENQPTTVRENQTAGQAADKYTKLRAAMVENDLKLRDISNKDVLRAITSVPRHEFVPAELREYAYADQPLPIGHDQTISQPYIVGLMTQLAKIEPNDTVLDVGTGSGYQAAILAELAKQVYSIEIIKPLADEARERLERLGYDNIEVRSGDGYAGWPEHAPFDAIIVAAAPDHVPPKLVEQLAVGARLVIPVGERGYQDLLVIEKKPDGSSTQWNVTPVAFVPMTGQAEDKSDR